MGPGFSRDVGAAERERGVNRPSLRCSRSRYCSMRLSLKSVSSLLPEAKHSIPRREADVTVQQVTSHCISCCILPERCPISLRNSWVLRSMVSCVKAGTRLDRPRSTAVPKRACAPGGPAAEVRAGPPARGWGSAHSPRPARPPRHARWRSRPGSVLGCP